MGRFSSLLREFRQIAREGTISGLIRYIRFKRLVDAPSPVLSGASSGIGIVGAGTYAASIHLPCLKSLKAPLYAVSSQSGVSARRLAHVHGIGKVYAGYAAMLADVNCDTVLLATPHYQHPEQLVSAINAGKYVYCEKPVAIDLLGLALLKEVAQNPNTRRAMVGFNRRFAPSVQKLADADWMRHRQEPLELTYRVNFGPRTNNAMSDPKVGGGRIHGAVCHYVDLIAHIAKSPIVSVCAQSIRSGGRGDLNSFVAALGLEDGSVASLVFSSEGSRHHDIKEEIMLSCSQHVGRITDFKTLSVDGRLYRFQRHRYGAMYTMQAFLDARKARAQMPISLQDGIAATSVTLALSKSIENGGKKVCMSRSVQ